LLIETFAIAAFMNSEFAVAIQEVAATTLAFRLRFGVDVPKRITLVC
jgi:hypothetical protein